MYQRILIPLDGSVCSEDAARVGLALAQRLGATVAFTYVAFVVPHAPPETEWEHADIHLGEMLLEHWDCDARSRGLLVQTLVERGPVSEAIVRVISRLECDLVVMGTHGRSGVDRLLVGSVAEGVTRRSPVPVLLVRAGVAGQPTDQVTLRPTWQRVLVPLDGGSTSAQTLRHGLNVARACGASVDVVSVVPALPVVLGLPMDPGAMGLDLDRLQREQDAFAAGVVQEAGEQVRAAGVPLAAADVLQAGARPTGVVIVEAARTRHADVIVMGSHARSTLEQLLGSAADHVIHRAGVPVLLVKAARAP